MSDIGYVRRLLAGVPDEATRRTLISAFEHVMANFRLGVPDHQTRAVNAQQYWLQSTTASDTSEFSIVHGLNAVPNYAFIGLELDRPGAGLPIVTVSRAADTRRVYLKASAGSTNVPFILLVEA